jgi:hypothetical protein
LLEAGIHGLVEIVFEQIDGIDNRHAHVARKCTLRLVRLTR